jgi:hypothetical protein
MIRDYIHYRRLGIRALQAIKMAAVRISTVEQVLGALVALLLLAATLWSLWIEYDIHYGEVIRSAHLSRLELSIERDKTAKWERLAVACLNHQAITVNGRSMSCRISEHTEAVDL